MGIEELFDMPYEEPGASPATEPASTNGGNNSNVANVESAAPPPSAPSAPSVPNAQSAPSVPEMSDAPNVPSASGSMASVSSAGGASSMPTLSKIAAYSYLDAQHNVVVDQESAAGVITTPDGRYVWAGPKNDNYMHMGNTSPIFSIHELVRQRTLLTFLCFVQCMVMLLLLLMLFSKK